MSRSSPSARRIAMAIILAATLVAAACASDDASSNGADATTDAPSGTASGDTTSTTGNGQAGSNVPVVFNGQGNNLVTYAGLPPYPSQQLITNAGDDPENGLDINAQICFWTEGDEIWFIAGEDTGQPDPPAGWGIFRLDGDPGAFEATQIGKLTPTYQEGAEPENYGCGLLSDGRMLTTDIGSQQLGPGSGQLIVWFPPFDSTDVAHCKIDVGIPTAQQIAIGENGGIYVASARSGVEADRAAGIWKYTGPFPTGPDEDGGCVGGTSVEVNRTLFIPLGDGLASPTGIVRTAGGGFYVSSVITGVINEYDSGGTFVRAILQPPEGEVLGEQSFSTGTPLGLGLAVDGTLYYADIGIVITPDSVGPGENTGSVRVITFDESGDPRPPETMAEGLPFPDGIGVYTP